MKLHGMRTEEAMKLHSNNIAKEIQPIQEKIHSRLGSIESSVFGQREMTRIEMKHIEDLILDET
eukprot:1920957-Heterocapsa_arctica.AAC.1